jgi:CubicO group peptidase (beta-lactamase class C family)
MSDDISSAFDSAIEAGRINGAILCAVQEGPKSKVEYNSTIGHRFLLSGEKRPHQLDDVIFLASGTKIIAAIAALQCVEDGLLTLDGDLSGIAPELAAMQVITGISEDGESASLEPIASPITLKMLLTHTSGLVYDFLSPLVAKGVAKTNPYQEGTRRTVENAFKGPLAFQPGTSWMYGTGLDWAGRVVERVTGRTLGEHVLERIYKPLGSNDISFYPVTREDLRARQIDLNPDDPEGYGMAVAGGSSDMNARSEGDFGGHGMYTTTPAFLRVLQSLMRNDGKLLKPATVDLMFQDHLNTEQQQGLKYAADDSPLAPHFRGGTEHGTKVGYGLSGLLTMEDAKGFYGKGTLTWGGGVTFTWWIDRQNGICGAGAIQGKMPIDIEAMTDLKSTFRRGVYREFEHNRG